MRQDSDGGGVTYAVAFDDSPLARTALDRAYTLGKATDREVLAVACVPDSAVRAREKGWIETGEEYELATVVERLERAVTDLAPGAEFRHETVGGGAPKGAVSGALQDAVEGIGPEVLFVGSERAGGVATSMESVAGTLIAGGEYDVYLVRESDAV